MLIQAYLYFNGRCDEAIEFYRGALGAEVDMLMRFKECPDPQPPGMLPPGFEDKVMHAALRIGETQLMLSDGCNPGPAGFQGFSLTITPPDVAAADRLFNALGDGGEVTMPLDKTFFSPRFGMLTDRFGVPWTLVVNP